MQVIASVTRHSSLLTLAVMGRNASIQTLKHHCLQTLLTALRSVIMCVDWQGLYHGEERPPSSRSNLSRRASRAFTTSCLMFEESSLDLWSGVEAYTTTRRDHLAPLTPTETAVRIGIPFVSDCLPMRPVSIPLGQLAGC